MPVLRRGASRFVSLLLAGAVSVGVGTGCVRGLRPPAGDLRDHLNGPSVSPTPFEPAGLEGKVTLVIFFATWCLPCLGQLALVRDLQDDYAARGFQAVAVGMDLDGPRMLRPFAEAYVPNLPVIVADEPLRRGETPFGPVREVPVSLILDRRGRFVVGWPGVAEADDIRRELERALDR